MPYVDRHGSEMKQIRAWIPMQLYHLVRADRLNISRFVRERLEFLHGDGSFTDLPNTKFRLVQGARETRCRQRGIVTRSEADRERLRATAADTATSVGARPAPAAVPVAPEWRSDHSVLKDRATLVMVIWPLPSSVATLDRVPGADPALSGDGPGWLCEGKNLETVPSSIGKRKLHPPRR